MRVKQEGDRKPSAEVRFPFDQLNKSSDLDVGLFLRTECVGFLDSEEGGTLPNLCARKGTLGAIVKSVSSGHVKGVCQRLVRYRYPYPVDMTTYEVWYMTRVHRRNLTEYRYCKDMGYNHPTWHSGFDSDTCAGKSPPLGIILRFPILR
jgi:hypothetical protein